LSSPPASAHSIIDNIDDLVIIDGVTVVHDDRSAPATVVTMTVTVTVLALSMATLSIQTLISNALALALLYSV
jgi:hypothetical protein